MRELMPFAEKAAAALKQRKQTIAIAESSGLMPHLTEYVLETALAQVAEWRKQGLFVPVAVNVSPRDVHTPGFAGSVAARLARHGVRRARRQ